MAFSHGSKAVFKVQDAASVLTDISAYLTDIGLPRKAGTAETTTLGKTSKSYIPGLKDATLKGKGEFDPTVDALLAGILGLARSFEYYPAGTGGAVNTNVKYSGTCICTEYDAETPVDKEGTFTVAFQCSDDVVRALV